MYKNNVIDLGKKRKSLEKNSKKEVTSVAVGFVDPSPIYDMTERRQEIIRQERREVRRTILTGFIGAFAVLPEKGLLKVEVYDISDNGMAFDIEEGKGRFKSGEEVAMRIYLNFQTYFPFTVKVKNVRNIQDEGSVRHGVNFVKGTMNDEALSHFVKFIETVSASLERDTGDVMVSNLKK